MILKDMKYIICTIVKYGETFYSFHMAPTPAAVYKLNVKKIAFGNKEHFILLHRS